MELFEKYKMFFGALTFRKKVFSSDKMLVSD